MKKTTKATKLGIILTISVILNILFGWIGGNPFSYARKINQAIELSSEIPAMQQAVGNMHNKMDAIATMIMLLCEKVDVNIPETIRRDILRNNHSGKPNFKIGFTDEILNQVQNDNRAGKAKKGDLKYAKTPTAR
jgi:hypothetical protein